MKSPPIILTLIALALLALVALPVPGSATDPPGGEVLDPGTPLPHADTPNSTNPRDPIPPVLLSWIPGNSVLSFFARPGTFPAVVYDRWEFILFGDEGTSYAVRINGKWIINGTLPGGWENVTWDARGINSALVEVRIGNRSYTWSRLIVKHQDIGWTPPELGGSGGFTAQDLQKARSKAVISILITGGALSAPIVYLGVTEYIRRRGIHEL